MSDYTILADVLAKYREFVERFPPLYYCLCDQVERGTMYRFAASENIPEFVMLHPDDLGELASRLRRKLAPLATWSPPT